MRITDRRHNRESEMLCEERIRLFDAYAAATLAYHMAVTIVNGSGETPEELSKTLMASVGARAKCVKARLALQEHKRQHRC